MKIAFIGQKGIPVSSGGVERRVQELSIRMAKIGHEVFVYARNRYALEKNPVYQGVNIIYLPSIETKNLGAITHTFLATVHAIFENYDVIHYQAPGPSSLCWLIKLFCPKTVLVATFNSQDDKHKKWGIIARTYLKFGEWIINNVPDKTIVVSEILQKYVRDEYGKDAVVIRNGAAVEATTSSHEIRKWNLEKRKYFLSVSRLVGHKGIHYLINAFKKAQENREIPDYFKLVIAGDSAHTDDYVAHLKNISKNNQNIIFLGNQFGINLSQLFANALAFVQPSEAEGLSNALLEAMGYGIAPIVSNIAENVAAVGKNGLSFENKNEDDLREKLVLAVKEPKLLEEFGRKARLDVLENYNWDKNAKKTLRLYADLLFQKNHKSLAVDYFKR